MEKKTNLLAKLLVKRDRAMQGGGVPGVGVAASGAMTIEEDTAEGLADAVDWLDRSGWVTGTPYSGLSQRSTPMATAAAVKSIASPTSKRISRLEAASPDFLSPAHDLDFISFTPSLQ